MKKIITVIGTRPQFVKASSVSLAFKDNNIEEVIINTGQHYDFNMSTIFIDDLSIPNIKYNLGVGSYSHGKQVGKILVKLDKLIKLEKPDAVLVYGDTNSTVAGALAASKLDFPVIHVEAGLRSFNKKMSEEINRVITDHISTILFCPSKNSKNNLEKEGINKQVYIVGDVMYDVFKRFKFQFSDHNKFGDYAILTLHRAENTTPDIIRIRLHQLRKIDLKIVFPIHPRTNDLLNKYSIKINKNIKLIDPVGWIELMSLIRHSQFVMTDSGGLQKEAFWHQKKCYTLRNETEWIETIKSNANVLIKEDVDELLLNEKVPDFSNPYGCGITSNEICKILQNY